MACNCTNPGSPNGNLHPTDSNLPFIADFTQLEGGCGTTVGAKPCCYGASVDSSESPGATLPATFTDARCDLRGEGITLLGRIGTSLAKLVGSGFIQITNGKAYVVSAIPLVVRQLWHNYWVSTGGTVPVPGDPKAFPYGVVADLNGNIYGIRGFQTKKSLHVWNFSTKGWETISPDQFPLEVSRRIFQSDAIELVGFDPISVLGSESDVRVLKALSGSGVVYLQREATAGADTAAGCEPCVDAGFAYVARVLEFPTLTPGEGEYGKHTLIYSSLGLYWAPVED